MIPSVVLNAVARPGGGQLVLVLGAGCSFEPPTDLPLSKKLAEDAHQQLILNEVLAPGDCQDPGDLSCVADAVYAKLGQQRALVDILPRQRMRNARPNDGSLTAAALLLENAISYIMLLNYDLSLPNALTQLGAEDEVQILRGPEDHQSLGAVNVVFLHRSVEADPEHWVLRTESLDHDWRASWEEVMARAVLAHPVVVFAGLGTPVGVLTETVKGIREALQQGTEVIAVDPIPRSASAYAQQLGLGDDHYVQAGWNAFMQQLGARLAAEHEARLLAACSTLHNREGLDIEDAVSLCNRIGGLGLVGLGCVRAEWLLSPRRYIPDRQSNPEHLADLLLTIGVLERAFGATSQIAEDGLVEFWADDRRRAIVRMASGQGSHRWTSLEERMRARNGRARPTFGVASGFVGPPVTATPPRDVVRGEPVARSIIDRATFSVLAADDIRADPQIATNMVAA
jgi:hypothetical protein